MYFAVVVFKMGSSEKTLTNISVTRKDFLLSTIYPQYFLRLITLEQSRFALEWDSSL
jgi:hypothetical protein